MSDRSSNTPLFWNIVLRIQCWQEPKLVLPEVCETCWKYWSLSKFIYETHLHTKHFLRRTFSWAKDQSEYHWWVKCKGLSWMEWSLSYAFQTFIFMGTSCSLGTLAIKCYTQGYCMKQGVLKRQQLGNILSVMKRRWHQLSLNCDHIQNHTQILNCELMKI